MFSSYIIIDLFYINPNIEHRLGKNTKSDVNIGLGELH